MRAGWNDTSDQTNVTLTFADLKMDGGAATAETTSFPKERWSYKQQGFVNVSQTTRYKCIEDILTHNGTVPYPPVPPPPPPGAKPACDKTPFGHCWTGCPSVQKNWSGECNIGFLLSDYMHTSTVVLRQHFSVEMF